MRNDDSKPTGNGDIDDENYIQYLPPEINAQITS